MTRIIWKMMTWTPLVQSAERGAYPELMCATEENDPALERLLDTESDKPRAYVLKDVLLFAVAASVMILPTIALGAYPLNGHTESTASSFLIALI